MPIILGGATFEMKNFTIKDVQKLVPLLKQADDKFIAEMGTVAQAQATTTIVHAGVEHLFPKYDDFMNLAGVTMKELSAAQQEIGRTIGYYKALDESGVTEQPGKTAGEG